MDGVWISRNQARCAAFRRRKSLAIAVAIVVLCGLAGQAGAVPGEANNLNWCAASTTCLQWSSVAGASGYGVYRGVPAQWPGLLNPNVDSCDRRPHGAGASITSLNEIPAPGTVYWYLVIAENPCGQGPAGSATAGSRIVNASGFCEVWCSDSALDGDETDLDCGGPSCAPCGPGKMCLASNDCDSRRCLGGICQSPTCFDGVSNGSETGVDCGGPCPDCATGQTPCTAAPMCLSNRCVDGVCCDSICSGVCQACTAAKKGSGSDGTCGNIGNGLDPDNECAGTATCNGNGACTTLSPNGTPCTLNSNCASNNCVDGVCCDTPCFGLCQACTAVKKGSGSDGTCGNIGNGLDPDNECAVANTYVCEGA